MLRRFRVVTPVLFASLVALPIGTVSHLVASQRTAAHSVVLDGSLNSIACVSATACIAVGSENAQAGGQTARSLIDAWNGHTWSKKPGQASESLTSASCVSAGWCLVLGVHGSVPFARSLVAGAWKDLAFPKVGVGTGSEASCVSPSWCVVTGLLTSGNGSYLEQWNGTSWQMGRFRVSASTSVDLTGVSCASRSMCLAVGSSGTSTARHPYSLTWNGATWTTAPVVAPWNATALTGVSCVATTTCFATGSKRQGTFSDRWSGHWSILAPMAKVAIYASFGAISCWSSRLCAAAGSNAYPRQPGNILADRWNGAAWTVAVNGGFLQGWLSSADCVGPSVCFVVGWGTPEAGGLQSTSVIEAWNGTTWTLEPSPN